MITTLSRNDYVEIGRQLMQECSALHSHEEASQHICEQLYHRLQYQGEPAMTLARIYRLTRIEDLPNELRSLVDPTELYAMTLTGTYGLLDNWRHRSLSQGHKAIPVNKIAMPAALPMFEQMLVREMGVNLERLYATHNVMESARATGGTFYIEDVPNSSVIPAQEAFVKPYEVKSLVGFGGLMADLERRTTLYVLFLFSKVHFTPEMAANLHEMRPFIGTALATKANESIFVS